jgi:hypothetical protein
MMEALYSSEMSVLQEPQGVTSEMMEFWYDVGRARK